MDELPIGTPPLNIQPDGLLDFFGIKNGRWGPRSLGLELAANIDLWRHYANVRCVDFDIQVTVNGVAAGLLVTNPFATFTAGITSAVVPNGEFWYIDQSVLQATITAGAGSRIYAMTVGAEDSTNGILKHLPMAPLGADIVSDANSGANALVPQLYPCFVRGGSTLAAYYGGNVAATEVLVLRWCGKLVRMRI